TAERDRGDLLGLVELVVGLHPVDVDAGRRGSRLLAQHHADGERRRLVVDEAERVQAVDQVGRTRMRPDLPAARSAAAIAQMTVDLSPNLVQLLRLEPK